MLARTVAGSGALFVSLAGPAVAQAAPTIAPLKPCYVTAETDAGPQSEGIQVIAAGFTPNSTVDLAINGAPLAEGSSNLQVDGTGGLNLPARDVPAPFVDKGTQPFTLTLTENGNPANTVSATAQSTALGVYVKPKTAAPRDRIRIWGRGFTLDGPIWAHYVRKGKLRKTVRMARRPGDCGSFDVHRRQIPIGKPHLGRWIVQFDQLKGYADPANRRFVYARLTIDLRLVRER